MLGHPRTPPPRGAQWLTTRPADPQGLRQPRWGGLYWIGLALHSFREGHPGVTGHVAHWARNFDMQMAP